MTNAEPKTKTISSLSQNRDFMRLWTGQTISEFGTWLGALPLLVELITAPLTLLLDAVSFLASAVVIARIKTTEPAVESQAESKQAARVWQDIQEELWIVFTHPLLRPIAATSATRSFFGGFFAALYGLFVLREVGLTPDRLLGRVNASFEFLVGTVLSAGILVGGLTGQWLGLRPAIAIAAVGILLSTAWLFLSPLRQVIEPAGWEVA